MLAHPSPPRRAQDHGKNNGRSRDDGRQAADVTQAAVASFACARSIRAFCAAPGRRASSSQSMSRLGLATALLVLLQATLLARVVARSFDGASLDDVSGDLVLLAFVFAGRAVLAWGFELAGRLAATGVLSQLRLELVERRLRDEPAALDGAAERQRSRRSRFRESTRSTPTSRGSSRSSCSRPLVPLAVIAWVGPIDLISAALMLLTLPLVPVFMVLIGRYTERDTRARWRALSLLSTHFLDVVRGLPTLRAFNRGRAQTAAIAETSEQLPPHDDEDASRRVPLGGRPRAGGDARDRARRRHRRRAPRRRRHRARGRTDRFSCSRRSCICPYAISGRSTTRVRTGSRWPSACSSSRSGPTTADSRWRRAMPRPQGATIRLEGVSYAYPARAATVLDGVDLELRPGETIGLVGASGSGKSTVASLAARARPADARPRHRGRGRARARPIASAWRRSLAWVPQQPTLFHGSIADNIRLGEPTADDESVVAAARLAGADDFVRALPDGYGTVVGDGGRPVSAGERQRIALARAFLRDASLVVLDEPTANLDPENAAAVTEAIERLGEGRTLLVVAHRPELVERADRTIRLDAGPRGGIEQAATPHDSTLRRLSPLHRRRAGGSRSRSGSARCAVIFGIGLMATAGYLISRAAEQPAILSLTGAIVAVRFFALARPTHALPRTPCLARPRLPRPRPHARPLLRADRAARTSGTRGVPAGRSRQPDGRRRGCAPEPVPARPRSSARRTSRPAPWQSESLPRSFRSPGRSSWRDCSSRESRCLRSPDGSRAPAGPPGDAQGHLTRRARRAPPRSARARRLRREHDTLARVREADRALVRLGRRDALAAGVADGLGIVVSGATVVAVLAVAVSAHAAGDLDRVLVAVLGCSRWRRSRRSHPCPQAARSFRRRSPPDDVCSSSQTASPPSRTRLVPAPPPPDAPRSRWKAFRAAMGRTSRSSLEGGASGSTPVERSPSSARAERGRRRSSTSSSAFSIPRTGASRSPVVTCGSTGRRTSGGVIAVAGQDAHLFSTSIRENVLLARPARATPASRSALRRAQLWEWVCSLPRARHARRRGGPRALGRAAPATRARTRAPRGRAPARPRRADGASRSRDGRGAHRRHL